MVTFDTFLAPGQRYTSISANPWETDFQLTILDVQPDPDGSPVVTYNTPGGSQITTHAVHVEEAVADGQIVPVHGFFRITNC